MVHHHLKSVLNRTKGRFTSFLVKDNSRLGLSVYSAKHVSATPKTVVFEDMNGAGKKRIARENVLIAQVAKDVFYRKQYTHQLQSDSPARTSCEWVFLLDKAGGAPRCQAFSVVILLLDFFNESAILFK